MKDEKVYADAADLELQIDMLEEFDANIDDKYNTQMICWLKELQQRRALQSGNSGQVPDEKLPLNYLQGQKDGLEWAAQMAEASHPKTGDWLYDDPVELAKAIRKGPDMPAASDGWIPVSERMTPCKTGVLVATEMDGPGDWRMKWATYVPKHPDAINGWLIPGASWTPTHWQSLPDAPKVK